MQFVSCTRLGLLMGRYNMLIISNSDVLQLILMAYFRGGRGGGGALIVVGTRSFPLFAATPDLYTFRAPRLIGSHTLIRIYRGLPLRPYRFRNRIGDVAVPQD